MKDPLGNEIREGSFVFWPQLGWSGTVTKVSEPHLAGNSEPSFLQVEFTIVVDKPGMPLSCICAVNPQSDKIVKDLMSR